MQQNYQATKLPTSASQSPSTGGVPWLNPSRITADDGSSSTLTYVSGGDSGASITGSNFGFVLPPGAVVDGVSLYVDGSQLSCEGDISLNIAGTTPKDLGTLSGTYGSSSDLWGAGEITAADIAGIAVTIDTGDVSGGDGTAQIDYLRITVYWHINLTAAPADVPVRFAYKAYSRGGRFLGELSNVTSPFVFTQDINSVGSSLQITCGKSIDSGIESSPLLTEDDDEILTEDDETILATSEKTMIALGSSPDEVLYKNSNRIKVYMYNYWYPNGKLMFSGQVNRVSFKYGAGTSAVQLMVYSDGMDMGNYIARGYPFEYTDDVIQTTENTFVTVTGDAHGDGWDRYGQTFTTGATVDNVGSISLVLNGSAAVTVSLYDAPNGNLIGSITKNIAYGGSGVAQFEFAQLLSVPPSTSRFFTVGVGPGQSIDVYCSSSSVYGGGTLHRSTYLGGSGGGTWSPITGDMWFITKSGEPTTTITYSASDPVTGMMSGVLSDYNARGGLVQQRDFEPSGLSLTYTFNMATIADVQKKTLELAPTGYYSFIDLGTAQMDMLPISETADFTIVRGKDVNQLDITLSIEQVKNNLYFTGGDDPDNPGENLFRLYPSTESTALYGLRIAAKSDNRVTLDDTADAIGETFIEENADETQETSVTVLDKAIDITLLTPGKTVGMRNFGGFVDAMILQIVRREFRAGQVTLTLGRLPVTMTAEVQRINRELLNEQTVNNPAQPA